MDGNIWLASGAALVRFDGARFTRFDHYNRPELGETSVLKLVGTRSGALWALFNDRLVRMQGSRAERVAGITEALAGLAEDAQGTVWAVARSGRMYRFDGSQMKQVRDVPVSPTALAHTIDSNSRFWIAREDGLYRFDSPKQPAKLVALSGTSVTSVSPARDGGVWFVTQRDGFGSVGPNGVTRFVASTGIPTSINNVVEAPDGGVFVAAKGGVFRFFQGRLTGMLRAADDAFGFLDAEGGLWVGGSRGIHRFMEGFFVPYRVPGIAGDAVPVRSVIATGAGSGYVGTKTRGLFRFQDGAFFQPPAWRNLLRGVVNQLVQDPGGNIWVASDDGLYQLNGNQLDGNQRLWRIAATPSSAVFADRNGSVLYGCPEGVCVWERGKASTSVSLQDFGDPRVLALKRSADGTLWVGTRGRGLFSSRDGGLKQVWNREGGSTILSIHEDREGLLWIGTESNGLLRYSRGNIGRLTQASGLLSDQIGGIVEDDDLCLWLSSNVGVIRVKRKALNQALDNQELENQAKANPSAKLQLASYDVTDGLPADDLSTMASSLSWNANRLWVATAEGLGVSRVTSFHTDLLPPEARIEEVRVDGAEREIPLRQIPPEARRLEIRFSAVGFSEANKTLFRYRLEGLDPSWSDSGYSDDGVRRNAVYTNLPPGDYTFEVQSFRSSSLLNPKTARLSFTVGAYFYQTRAFWVGAALSLMTVLWVAYRLRIGAIMRQFNAVFEERRRLSGELHDTLVQGLSGAIYELQALRSTMRMHDPKLETRLSHVIHGIMRSARDARFSLAELRSASLAKGDLNGAFDDLSLDASPHVRLRKITIGTARVVSGTVAHNFFRIAQEAVTNAVRHSGASEIEIKIEYLPTRIAVEIKDEGCGFDPSTQSGHGIGLSIIRERAERCGASVSVVSAPGAGTTVRVEKALR